MTYGKITKLHKERTGVSIKKFEERITHTQKDGDKKYTHL